MQGRMARMTQRQNESELRDKNHKALCEVK